MAGKQELEAKEKTYVHSKRLNKIIETIKRYEGGTI